MAACTLRITVVGARGHGPHGLLPHEETWCQLWVQDGSLPLREFQVARKRQPLWNETFELPLDPPQPGAAQQGAPNLHLRLRMRGRLPGHERTDEVGSGSFHLVNLKELQLEADGRERAVHVPIITPVGKEAGEVELRLAVRREAARA